MRKIRNEAESIFNRIGEGHKSAVKRPMYDMNIDRSLRAMINHANKNGDCIIASSDGLGYYRPLPNDHIDVLETKRYMRQEHNKVLDTKYKELCMIQALKARGFVDEF